MMCGILVNYLITLDYRPEFLKLSLGDDLHVHVYFMSHIIELTLQIFCFELSLLETF